MFFAASADPQLASGPNQAGPVNVSPKGGVPLHILGPNQVAYLDYRGSGNETARHYAAGGPVTIMVCSFEEEVRQSSGRSAAPALHPLATRRSRSDCSSGPRRS